MADYFLDALIEAISAEKLKEIVKIATIARSRNFSDLPQPDGKSFDAGDEGVEEEAIFAQIEMDTLVLLMLGQFTDREKVIFMYQLLRDAGFNFRHEDCARTVSVTRERYMVLLKQVRKKSAKILQIPVK